MFDPVNMLEFSEVTLRNVPHGQAEMRQLTFSAGPGSLALIKVETGNEHLPLADAAEGIIAPETGLIRWQGKEWNRLAPRAESCARARIGRVFEKDGWLSNLDVLENVTLAQRHHTRRPEDEIIAEADSLARNFGIPEVPRQRPSFTAKRELRIAEWVRAFLASPLLLLLERPEEGVKDDSVTQLIAAVQSARARGAAVIWQTDRDIVWQAAQLLDAIRYRMQGTDMILVEGKQL